MAQPYVGEIRMFAGNFAPTGWAFCEGQLIPISENETLFNLIGTTFGGDGQSTFAMPDLRGRIPIHQGNGGVLAEMSGAESVFLTVPQIPSHTHTLLGTLTVANDATPANNVLAQTGTFDGFQSTPGAIPLAAQSIVATGGSQPHDNFQPYLCVNFIISLFGIFPSQ
jgi:microcystin-dependent protein